MSSFLRLLVVAVVAVAAATACSKAPPVQCPTVQVVQDFEVARYLVQWFEIERSPQPFQPDGACVTAVYRPQSNSLHPVRAVNRQLNDNTGEYSARIGNVRVAEPDKTEGKLKVQFEGTEESDYWVVATDYDNYALVYSCRKVESDNSIYQSAWVLGRKNILDITTKRLVDVAFQKSGIDRDILVKTRQDETCNYLIPIVPEPV